MNDLRNFNNKEDDFDLMLDKKINKSNLDKRKLTEKELALTKKMNKTISKISKSFTIVGIILFIATIITFFRFISFFGENNTYILSLPLFLSFASIYLGRAVAKNAVLLDITSPNFKIWHLFKNPHKVKSQALSNIDLNKNNDVNNYTGTAGTPKTNVSFNQKHYTAPPTNTAKKHLKNCPNCNHLIGKDSSFCNKCGSLLKVELRCKCGTINSDDAMYCFNCGEKLKDSI